MTEPQLVALLDYHVVMCNISRLGIIDVSNDILDRLFCIFDDWYDIELEAYPEDKAALIHEFEDFWAAQQYNIYRTS